jgi:uncharacterized ferritin-like protein (DUF455 family)
MGGTISKPFLMGAVGLFALLGARAYRRVCCSAPKLVRESTTTLSPQEEKPLVPSTLLEYAALVLNTASIEDKYTLTLEAKRRWHAGTLPIHSGGSLPLAPSSPSRPTTLKTMDSRAMDQRSAVKDANLSRLLLVHSLCHIEAWAIDLSWDVLLRFAGSPLRSLPEDNNDDGLNLPQAFFADWLRIATEEARHWNMWRLRLIELGSHYGAFPVHDGLWQSADETSHDFLARLAIVHMTHEARGLDVTPRFLAQMHSAGDLKSANLLKLIEEDEISHVASGVKWFNHACLRQQGPVDPIPTFHALVKQFFRGSLKPPFCTESRHRAGFTEEWYIPLVTSQSAHNALEAAKKREVKIKQKAEAREQARARNQRAAKSSNLQSS